MFINIYVIPILIDEEKNLSIYNVINTFLDNINIYMYIYDRYIH